MANKDYSLPFQDLTNLVPQNLRNPMITSLIDNLFNRFLTKDEAVPLYGYVGRKPAAPDDRSPKIPQASVERDINALVPVISFKVGTETHSFTIQDLIRKAEVLGVTKDQASWLYSQGNNYAPPINFDRFTNFFNYCWVARALPNTPEHEWNPTLAPEYYTIAAPKPSDLDKLNVVAASTGPLTLTGTGFEPQTWVVEFQSDVDFTVTATGAGISPSEATQSHTLIGSSYTVNFIVSGAPGPLLTFKIVRDPIYNGDGDYVADESFAAGDSFTIAAPFLSSTYSVTPNQVGPGVKGKITAVDSLDEYQSIDGVLLTENDRVLVMHNGSANGIYVVKPGAFVRADDYAGANITAGARVFDRNRSRMYVSDALNAWTLDPSTAISNTNNWQESNYWMHRDDAAAAGLDISKVIQATRPIIEFHADLPLNKQFKSELAGGPILFLVPAAQLPVLTPTDAGGTEYEQVKTEFNQVPLFDLYRYDGTHAGKVSPIFFYVEDPTADIDPALQRRVKHATNESGDFVFAHGLLDGDSLLFYKKTDGALHSIWHPGYSAAQVIDQSFGGDGDGTLAVTATSAFNAQQIWTLTAISPTVFEVTGSKNKVMPTPFDKITVGVAYDNGLFQATITAGGTAFSIGDTFTFRIGNFETTRYVYRDEAEAIYDLFGGPEADDDGVGAWQVPRMFYNNVAADNGGELPEGTLYSHFRGVLLNQMAGAPEDRAFGGSIKLWSEQQNLLASLLMQRDMTPISVIDLAQRQYEVGLNAISDIFMKELIQYFNDVEVMTSPTDVTELVDFILSIRAKDNDVRSVLYDSTASVVGFPATLPMLGVTPLVQPGMVFDNELGATLFRHHDGHLSPLFTFTQDFRDRLLSPGMMIKRSDGTFTPAVGSFTTTAPAMPHKGELWFYPLGTGQVLRAFNVLSDGSIAPTATAIGQHWYNRAANQLYVWDGALWQPEANALAPWVELDPAQLLNDVMFEVERRLHDGINEEHRTYFDAAEVTNWLSGPLAVHMQREIATWAATNGYDPIAPDYVSSDAFTWNYSSLGMPARWYKALQAHQESVAGVIPTSRPNLEPWKLLGNAAKPAGWDAQYAADVTPEMVDAGGYITGTTARLAIYSSTPVNTVLSGTPVIDGRVALPGDRVLLISELAPQNNGLWIVSAGGWSRDSVSLVQNLVISVMDGNEYGGTDWVLTATATPNVDPVLFDQVRMWKGSMWTDIQTARPALKLSVDTARDALLPPYVNASFPYSVNALTTTMPSTPAAPYVFGEGSPVETVWTKSVEFRYSLARALFRADPLAFLGHCWGFNWVEVDGILYDGFDITVPGHRRFRLHGDVIAQVQRTQPFTIDFGGFVQGPGPIDLAITFNGYTATRGQSFMVKAADGTIVGYLNEGALTTLTGSGYTLHLVKIEDEGKPFRMGDSFHITANADGSGMLITFEPSSYHRFHGFGQTFTHALRAGSIDTQQGYAIQAFKGWDVNLGYRAGGLVSTDDLRVFTDADAIPESAYALRFKRSPFAKDLWAQGLRVSVVQIGSSKAAPIAGFVPTNDASDWVFRVEGYNSRFLGIEYFDLDTAGEFMTFNALSNAHTDREFKQYTEVLDTLSTQLPVTITGLQNLVTFLFGYSKKLEADGWRFQDENGGNVDAETGRVRNWQLEIEKIVDRVYAGIDLDQGHVLVPFMDRIWLEQDTGLLSRYFDSTLFDVTGHPGVFDTLGSKINTDDLTILRSRGVSMISASVPMFSVHAQIDEFEHLFVFNNMMSPSTGEGLIYDPFSGARIVTIKLNGRRQAAQTLRPEFGGHYLVGDEVKRNLQSSTDKVAQYYDTDHVFEDELSTRHALALLGFSPKQYMADLDLNDRTQFNFWRGLVQMKGTNSSIDAFLNNDRFFDAKLDEYWAYKVAEYGDARPKLFPELKLTVDDTLQQFTKLQFDSSSEIPGFTQISMGDEERWFSIDDLETNNEAGFEAAIVGNYTRTFGAPAQIKLPFIADEIDVAFNGVLQDPVTGPDVRRLNMTTFEVLTAGDVEVMGCGPATPKFNPVKLFNYINAELIEEIPVWHPATGQHTPVAMESINVVSNNDPARYNVSTQVIGNANYDPLRMWGGKEVGRVWWDTTNLDYVPYYDSVIYPDVDGRLSRWGTLADYATMDIVEWVESTVPPSEYDAQSALDAGDADLDPYTKADGTVYGAKTYARDRVWQVRPIAWSRAGVPTQAAHPSFNGSYDSTLNFEADGLMWLETGTFDDYGVAADMRIGGWQQDGIFTRPVSEYLVTDEFTKHIVGVPVGDVSLSVIEHTGVVGQLSFSVNYVTTPLLDADGFAVGDEYRTYVYVTEVLSGDTDVVLIRTEGDDMFTLTAAQTTSFDLAQFGLRITHTLPAGTYRMIDDPTNTSPYDHPAELIASALANVEIFDAVRVEVVVPGIETSFSNDDPDVIGWRAWNVPTQAQLDADSRVPHSSWYPYVGEFVTVSPSIEIVQEAAEGGVLTLNDGTAIERYNTNWSNWTELKNTFIRQTATVNGSMELTVPAGTTADQVSVYVNGVAQLTGTYSLVGTALTIGTVTLGSEVVVIVRAYAPTAEELEFDPSVADDVLIQRQYKVDYQYVEVPVRGTDGTISTTKYYFWVKNRSTASRKKSLSVKAIAQLLTSGPSNYLTFQGLDSTTSPYKYDAITISGLSNVVSKDDTFKLRFTRNFTLRDDPNQLDLKDVHVEWALIRPGQRTKIPEALWEKLVNAACGADAAGNLLPSPRRVAYDERNGTRTQFGFGKDQVLAPSDLVRSTLLFTILNTKLVDDTGSVPVPDYMTFLDFNESDTWFSPENARNTLTRIWNEGKVSQINELFFAVLEDILASNYELTDIFKTSRLSAYSIKVVRPSPIVPTYE